MFVNVSIYSDARMPCKDLNEAGWGWKVVGVSGIDAGCVRQAKQAVFTHLLVQVSTYI